MTDPFAVIEEALENIGPCDKDNVHVEVWCIAHQQKRCSAEEERRNAEAALAALRTQLEREQDAHEATESNLVAAWAENKRYERALRELLFWMADQDEGLLSLTAELRDDLMRFYEPEKGWPPHIESARNLGDFEQAVSDARAALSEYCSQCGHKEGTCACDCDPEPSQGARDHTDECDIAALSGPVDDDFCICPAPSQGEPRDV